MYSILINKKDYLAKTLEVTVFVCNYDFKAKTHLPLPQHASFFLDFLINANKKQNSPAKLLLEGHTCNNTFLSIYNNKFIEKVELLSTNNYPLAKWQQKYHNKKTDKNEDYSQLVQGTYIIHLVDELYMDDFHKDFHYTGIFRDIPSIDDNILAKYNLPNTQDYIDEISTIAPDYIQTAQQVKISNNNDYIFFTYNEKILCIVNTANWTFKYEFFIENAHYKLGYDNTNNIVWVQDYDKIIKAFDLNTCQQINYTNTISSYMSASMNFRCNWYENKPINIKNSQGNILFAIPNKDEIFYNLAFCPNDKLIAIGYAKSIDIWDIEKQILIKSLSFEKGFLHKLIFSHDSSIIYILVQNTIYGITIEESFIIFEYTSYHSNEIVKDFDISDKYLAILEVPNTTNEYLYRCCYIYEINTNPFTINSTTLQTLKNKSQAKRKQYERWAIVLKNIPYNEKNAPYIEELKYDLGNHYIWCILSESLSLETAQLYSALEAAKIALKISFNNKNLFNLSTSYTEIGDYKNAIFYLRKYLKTFPFYSVAYYNLSYLLSSAGEYKEAINLMYELLEISPDSILAYTNLSIFYIESKDLEKARAEALQGISKGNKTQCSMNLAHTYYLQNDIETARQYYETSLQNFDDKEQFFKDMISDYDVLSLYDIPQYTWYAFVEEFRAIPV